MKEKIKTTVQFIKSKYNQQTRVGIVLGSGLGDFANQIENKVIIPYGDIPHFKKTTVAGHSGELILGTIHGVHVCALKGRFHLYEGHHMEEVIFPTRVLKALGVEMLILTNASGGINLNYKPGDLVLIRDHINLMGQNPLTGPNDESFGTRFPDMSQAYNHELRKIFIETAKELKHEINEGVYAGVLGPTYETPSEIKMIRILGGDMVGMSTVPETITAHHMGMKVCGISCITNMGAGIKDETLSHDHIKDVALKARDHFTSLLTTAIKKMGSLK